MIGFYDSGIGGLAILIEVLELNPNTSFEYFADYKFLPLGSKSKEEIVERTKTVCQFLFQNCDLVILVCNTASVNAIRELQQNWLPKFFPDKQILGISKPILELLEQKYSEFKNQKITLLSTPSTHNSKFYLNEITSLGFENVTSVACFGLAQNIENQNIETQTQILGKIKNSPNLILLACTHYTLAKELIQKLQPHARIVDPSQFIAQQIVKYTISHPKYYQNFEKKREFWTSKDTDKFAVNAKYFFEMDLDPKFIDL